MFGRQTMGQALPAMTKRLPNGDVLMYAIGDFVTSTGQRLEGEGVIPDEIVPLSIARRSPPAGTRRSTPRWPGWTAGARLALRPPLLLSSGDLQAAIPSASGSYLTLELSAPENCNPAEISRDGRRERTGNEVPSGVLNGAAPAASRRHRGRLLSPRTTHHQSRDRRAGRRSHPADPVHHLRRRTRFTKAARCRAGRIRRAARRPGLAEAAPAQLVPPTRPSGTRRRRRWRPFGRSIR